MRIWIVATLAALLTLVGTVVSAQTTATISPVVSECSRKCQGTFHLIDDSNVPMTFVVDVVGVKFSKETQGPVMSKLDDASIKLRLSSMSGRLSPHESREINFKFECPDGDCQIAFMSTMGAIGRKDNEARIKVVLPHIAYSCFEGGAHDCRKRTLASAGVVPPEER